MLAPPTHPHPEKSPNRAILSCAVTVFDQVHVSTHAQVSTHPPFQTTGPALGNFGRNICSKMACFY